MLTALILFACAGARTEPEATAQPAVQPAVQPATLPAGSRGEGSPTVAAPTEGAPASVDTLRGLLLAHHTEDLPARSDLEKHPEALESLAWLARYDDKLVVRERALTLLGQWTSEPVAAAVCAEVLASTAPAGARAAAASCLATQGLRTDAALRAQVVGALRDTDPRVGAAAAMALAGVAEARADLQAAADDASLPEETRAAAQSALRYR